MPSPERPPVGPTAEPAPDRNLIKEYGSKYIEVQRAILAGLPTEDERLEWAGRYGGAFHDLAAVDVSFHELVMSEKPNIGEIKRRVEEHGGDAAEERK